MCQAWVEPSADGRYQWDKLSAGPDKHQRFRRPASEACRSRTKGQSALGHIALVSWIGRPIHETTTKYGLVRIGPKSHFFFLCCDAFGLATTLYYLFYPEHVTRPRTSHEGFWRGYLRWGDGWTGWHHVFSGSLLSRPSRPELLVPAVPEGQRLSCSSGAEERAFDVGVGFLWCGASEHAVPHRTRHHAGARRTCRANGCYSCQGFHGCGYKCQGKTRSGWSNFLPLPRSEWVIPRIGGDGKVRFRSDASRIIHQSETTFYILGSKAVCW